MDRDVSSTTTTHGAAIPVGDELKFHARREEVGEVLSVPAIRPLDPQLGVVRGDPSVDSARHVNILGELLTVRILPVAALGRHFDALDRRLRLESHGDLVLVRRCHIVGYDRRASVRWQGTGSVLQVHNYTKCAVKWGWLARAGGWGRYARERKSGIPVFDSAVSERFAGAVVLAILSRWLSGAVCLR